MLTVIAGFVGAAIANRREHAKWTREHRMNAYRDFLREAERPPEGERDPRLWSAYLDELGVAYATIELVGPDLVAEAALDHFLSALDYSSARDHAGAAWDSEHGSEEEKAAEIKRLDDALEVETDRQRKTRRAFVLAARKELSIEDRSS